MSDESDAKQIFIASSWRTGDHHWEAHILRGWRLPSRTWNHWTSPWTKQLTWLRIIHSREWCLCLALCTHSGACQKWMNEWMTVCSGRLSVLCASLQALLVQNVNSSHTLKSYGRGLPSSRGGRIDNDRDRGRGRGKRRRRHSQPVSCRWCCFIRQTHYHQVVMCTSQ